MSHSQKKNTSFLMVTFRIILFAMCFSFLSNTLLSPLQRLHCPLLHPPHILLRPLPFRFAPNRCCVIGGGPRLHCSRCPKLGGKLRQKRMHTFVPYKNVTHERPWSRCRIILSLSTGLRTDLRGLPYSWKRKRTVPSRGVPLGPKRYMSSPTFLSGMATPHTTPGKCALKKRVQEYIIEEKGLTVL